MADRKYPFLAPFLEAGSGTVYVLSDPNVRLRDSVALLLLTRFFAEHHVNVEIQAQLARHRRLFDESEVVKALSPGSTSRGNVENVLANTGADLEGTVNALFKEAAQAWADAFDGLGGGRAALSPRGPILVLGRPCFFPPALREQIEVELKEGGDGRGVSGRFCAVSDEREHNFEQYYAMRDRFSGIVLPFKPYSGDAATSPYVDYAVIRMVEAPSRHSVFVLAHGTSSLGTQAAAQALVDDVHNQSFELEGVTEFFREHRYVEVLLQVEGQRRLEVPWFEPFEPREIQLIGPPVDHGRSESAEWVRWFEDVKEPDDRNGAYQFRGAAGDTRLFDVVGIHPSADRVWPVIGGAATKVLVDRLKDLAADRDVGAVLLVGETGTGKELAARLLFEERARCLLSRLGSDTFLERPVVVGPRYVPVNCGGTAFQDDNVRASLFFGVLPGVAHGVIPKFGSILEAGEGVVLLDELESMPLELQVKLLRAMQPPYAVTPVGANEEVPCSALVVAATNEDPDLLVSEGKLRADLYARLRDHVVRIPSLAERPGDVPALLSFFAGRPVVFDSKVLTCLLGGRLQFNARSLVHIVRQAEERHQSENPNDPLVIELQDLDPKTRRDFSGLLRQAQERDKAVRFQFACKVSSTRLNLGNTFEQFCQILASLRVGDDGELGVRSHASIRDKLWGKEPADDAGSQTTNRRKRKSSPGESRARQRDASLVDLKRQCYRLFRHYIGRTPGPELEEARSLLTQLFKIRVGKKEAKYRQFICDAWRCRASEEKALDPNPFYRLVGIEPPPENRR